MERNVKKFNERVEKVEQALSHLQHGCVGIDCKYCRLNRHSGLCKLLKSRISTVK